MKEVLQVQVAAGVILRARLNERNTLSFAIEYADKDGPTFVQVTPAEADIVLRMRQSPWTTVDEQQAAGLANAR